MDKIAYYINEIEKMAALNKDVKLYPHQKRVVEEDSTSKILAHPTGSGKTLTAIAKFEKMRERGQASKALVVVPAGLRQNFDLHGIKKFTNSSSNIIGSKAEKLKGIDPKADYNIISYDIFKRNPEKYIKESGADTIITDESHRSKNEDTAVTNALKRTRKMYRNYLGMTGSVVSNSISDVQPLVDVASRGRHFLGKNKKEFNERWLKRDNSSKYKDVKESRRPVVGFKNPKLLESGLKQYVDYVDPESIKSSAKMPEKHLNVKMVTISKEQAKLYKKLLNNNPGVRQMIMAKRLELLNDEDAAKAYSKLIEARKLMNAASSIKPSMDHSIDENNAPKVKALMDEMEKHLKANPKGRALLFSNLITGGTDLLEQGLKERHIPYGRFIGKGNKGVTEESRQADVENYTKGKNRAMIISSAGGEGLSLGNTTWEGVLDPHYNPEKMKQMEARGIRSGAPQKSVEVNRYISTMPKVFKIFKSRYKTPDEFAYDIAMNKEKSNQKLFNLLKNETPTEYSTKNLG